MPSKKSAQMYAQAAQRIRDTDCAPAASYMETTCYTASSKRCSLATR